MMPVMAGLAIISSSCAHETVYLKPRCDRPDEPVIPRLEGANEKMQCISDETYEFLVLRDVTRKTYADELNAVLDEVCASPVPVE